MSWGNFIRFKSQNFWTIFFPKPSILKASFETKCFNFSIETFSHSKPSLEQRLTASFFFVVLLNSFIVFDPHEGHFVGNTNLLDFDNLFFKSTDTIWGITSPALSTSTISFTLISFLIISSSLCKVAFETTTPPILIGLIFATGVSAPVLPIWISISNILEIPLLAENLWAIAHLGALATFPSLFCNEKLFIL